MSGIRKWFTYTLVCSWLGGAISAAARTPEDEPATRLRPPRAQARREAPTEAAGDRGESVADTIVWQRWSLDRQFASAGSVTVADVDGDGDRDVLSASSDLDTITWWRNELGDATEWSPVDVTVDLRGASSVHAADIDGDGDVDVLGTAAETHDIIWLENRAGNGLGWTWRSVEGALRGAVAAVTADVDGDGDLDVVGAGEQDDTVGWWENRDGVGTLWMGHPIDEAFDGVRAVRTADIDGDGDTDVVGAASAADEVAWWENDGEAGLWSRHSIAVAFDGATAITVADLDGDGDPDVLGAASAAGAITWWENEAGDGSSWRERAVDEDFDGAASVSAADVDRDGDLDLLAAGEAVDEIAWWSNDQGDGSVWSKSVVDGLVDGAAAVQAADLDDDGDADIVGAGALDGQVSVWFSDECFALALGKIGPGAAPGAALDAGGARVWREDVVGVHRGTSSVQLEDVDLDGDLDVIAAAVSTQDIAWWENQFGDGSSWSRRNIEFDFEGAASIDLADVDGDGDSDVVGAAMVDGVAWWENPVGDGGPWIEHDLDGSFGGALWVVSADVDGDGDADVVSAHPETSAVVWRENLAGDGLLWIEREIDDNYLQPVSVVATDVDGDGDLDVAGSSDRGGGPSISWWENLDGEGLDWLEHEVDAESSSIPQIDVADVDGDGDTDFVGTTPVGGSAWLAWWENVAGDGSVWVEHFAYWIDRSPSAIEAADVDGDGDIDAVVGHELPISDSIHWYENRDGVGSEWNRHLLSFVSRANTLAVGDVNSDLGLDVVAGLPTVNSGVTWWRNAEPNHCPGGQFHADDVVRLTADPAPGAGVDGWTGTDDDETTSSVNEVTMPARSHEVTVHYLEGCFQLTADHTGMGADPVVLAPLGSDGCPVGRFVVGETIEVEAAPAVGWVVESWVGTDDAGASLRQQVTMPAADHAVTVHYASDPTCYVLTRDRGGSGTGSIPAAVPPNSPGCPADGFRTGEPIELVADPGLGSVVGGWVGTEDDASQEPTNTLIMPTAAHTVEVHYTAFCYPLALTHTGLGSDPAPAPRGVGELWGDERWVDGDFNNAHSVRAADIDGDGDTDIVGAARQANDVTWWENQLGDGEVWSRRRIDDEFRNAESVATADVDGDGDLDVLAAADGDGDGEIAWWENRSGNGSSWTKHPVAPVLDGASSVRAADVDGDGDLDVVGAADIDDVVSWWENLVGDGSSWLEHPIDSAFDGAQSVQVADVDGDGDLDVLGAARDADAIRWWENLAGDGSSWTGRPIDDAFDFAFTVEAADVDGDGDVDVLGAADEANEISWWENLFGDGSAWAKRVIDDQFSAAREVWAADLDADGDIDALGAGFDSPLTWWENETADGRVWRVHEVAVLDDAQTVHTGDFDGDGDLDVVAGSDSRNRVSWFENVYDGICPSGEYRFTDAIQLRAEAALGWRVGGWKGTDDDAITSAVNVVTMPNVDHAVTVDYVEAAGGPTLSIVGSCPGEIGIQVKQARPFARVALMFSTDFGIASVPAGDCAGTLLDLESPRLLTFVTADGDGVATLQRTAPAGACGRLIQALDESVCEVTPVEQLP